MKCDVMNIRKNVCVSAALSSGTNMFYVVFLAYDEGTDGVSSICDEDQVVAPPDGNMITVDAETFPYS